MGSRVCTAGPLVLAPREGITDHGARPQPEHFPQQGGGFNEPSSAGRVRGDPRVARRRRGDGGSRRTLRRGRRASQSHGRLQGPRQDRSEEHTSELQSPCNLVCRLLLEKKKNKIRKRTSVLR